MDKTFDIVVRATMPSDVDPLEWMGAVLETAFKKKNPVPCPGKISERINWKPEIAVPAAEHPYRPVLIKAVEVTHSPIVHNDRLSPVDAELSDWQGRP